MKQLSRLLGVIPLLALTATAVQAQPATPLTSGLVGPIKVILTPRGNLVVAEAGNGPNTGRVSVINRLTGAARPVLSGLPSAISRLGSGAEPSGPSGLAIASDVVSIDSQTSILYISIGSGDAVLPGPVPGSEVLNPSASSPIFSSVLSIATARPLDEFEGGFSLSPADHTRLKNGEAITLGSTSNALTVRLVADFPDFRFEPRPDFSGNVRSSNPFGLALRGDTLYVVDASFNSIRTVNRNSGAVGTLVTFPSVTNPAPIGPPSIDAVPDSIKLSNGQLLVSTLTGFPFPSGAARIATVDPSTGAITTRASNLTSLIDASTLRSNTGGEAYLALQFSTNMLAGAPGNLMLVDGTSRRVIASPLITPTSMAVDSVTGEIFITLLGPGQVVRVNAVGQIPLQMPPSVIPVVVSSAGIGGAQFETAVQLTNPYFFPISGTLILRTAGGDPTSDPRVTYTLASHETKDFPNILTSFGRTGLGSVDIVPTVGPAPTAIVRVFDSVTGNGFFEEALNASATLSTGQRSTLVAPSDPSKFRMNIGIRTFGAGATVTLRVFHANGIPGASATREVPANSLVQLQAGQLLGADLQANDSIVVEVTQGSAIIYGSVINNQSQASSIQIARPLPDV